MNLLAIDTSTEKFSTAVAAGKDTWLFEADAGLRHSELIMDSIDALFKMAAIKPEDLSGIVCMGGPGSFTGLRIGFSVAKGIALAQDIPFAAIPTLDCMAQPFRAWPGIAVPVLDAKKQAFFCALYREGRRLCPDMDAGPQEIAQTIAGALESEQKDKVSNQVLLFGPGAQMLFDTISLEGIKLGRGLRWGNAETLLEIAIETQILTKTDTGYSAGPEYIRKSDAELTKNK